MKKQITTTVKTLSIIIFSILFTSCENDDSSINEETEIIVLPLEASFEKLYPGGEIYGESGHFDTAIWTNNIIQLLDSTNENGVSWITFNEININEVGQYNLLYSPNATAKFEAIYSTSVSPDFWINQDADVEQGGFINITDYSSVSISGNYYFIAWYFSSTLNREVGWGISGTFENIQRQN